MSLLKNQIKHKNIEKYKYKQIIQNQTKMEQYLECNVLNKLMKLYNLKINKLL